MAKNTAVTIDNLDLDVIVPYFCIDVYCYQNLCAFLGVEVQSPVLHPSAAITLMLVALPLTLGKLRRLAVRERGHKNRQC